LTPGLGGPFVESTAEGALVDARSAVAERSPAGSRAGPAGGACWACAEENAMKTRVAAAANIRRGMTIDPAMRQVPIKPHKHPWPRKSVPKLARREGRESASGAPRSFLILASPPYLSIAALAGDPLGRADPRLAKMSRDAVGPFYIRPEQPANQPIALQ
jgi:hypothetical protein